jgi:ribulose 1,5-bisphosphate carboxylase large subunit-like protein
VKAVSATVRLASTFKIVPLVVAVGGVWEWTLRRLNELIGRLTVVPGGATTLGTWTGQRAVAKAVKAELTEQHHNDETQFDACLHFHPPRYRV